MVESVLDKVRNVMDIYYQIRRENKKGIRDSSQLDRLKEKLDEVEKDINNDLTGAGREMRVIEDGIKFEGKFVPAIVLNYCFRNFSRVMGRGNYPTVLDNVPRVLDFMEGVKTLKGHRVLSINGGNCLFGRISGPSRIDNDRVFYNMMIPVERESFLRLQVERARPGIIGKWGEPYELSEGEPEIFVDKNLLALGRGSWRQGEMSYNRSNPQGIISDADLSLYLGDGPVHDRFRRDFVIPEQRLKVQLPD